ncbi:MAG: ABC transporter permease [Clostridia bacterium]|nr:ABC transporter permease [Clostridia bacterium]
MKNKKNNTMLSLVSLVKRNVTLYLKDKGMVFFSFLAPVIVLMLYILFLGDMQVDAIRAMLQQPEYAGVNLSDTQISAIINNWMIAGVMAVSCITVSFNANTIMVRDRERGNINDVLASPVKRWVVYASYVLSCFIITLCICLAVLVIALIYLACTGGFMMNFAELLAILGITVLSILSASLMTVLMIGFIKSEGALSAICGVFSAAIGFLIGAYIPASMLPETVQNISGFIPGTYSAGLFRNYFLSGPVRVLSDQVPPEVIQNLLNQYSIDLNFFGMKVSAGWMVGAILISILIFAVLMVIFYSNKKTNFFSMTKKKKKKKIKKAKVVKTTKTATNEPSKVELNVGEKAGEKQSSQSEEPESEAKTTETVEEAKSEPNKKTEGSQQN